MINLDKHWLKFKNFSAIMAKISQKEYHPTGITDRISNDLQPEPYMYSSGLPSDIFKFVELHKKKMPIVLLYFDCVICC